MKDSFFSYTNAVYAAGDGIKHTVLDNVETASVRVSGGLDNVVSERALMQQRQAIEAQER